MKRAFILILFICNATFSQIEKIKIEKEDSIFTNVDKQPEFPGGFVALLQFVNKNMDLPSADCPAFGCKTFRIKFMITSSGEVKDVTVKTNMPDCPPYANELARVFKLMPQWKPAIVNGVAVNTYFILPFRIRLG